MHGGPGDPDPDDVKTYEIKNSDGYTAKEYDKLPFFEKMMTTDPRVIASSGGLELIGSGPAKGAKWAAKMMRKYPGSISQVKSIGGKYWKYTIEVAGENGMTIHTKYLNMQGKTMKYFHDTYNSAGKYMHRGWTEGSVKVHQWWNGVQQYGKHYFINR